MRTPLPALAVVLLLSSAAPATDEAAQAIVTQAIESHGGAVALAKTRLMIQTLKGEITTEGATFPATSQETLHLPERCRWTHEIEVSGQKVSVQVAINGDKGWRSGLGAVQELSRPELDELRERAYAAWLTTLLPLRDKGFTLNALPEIKVEDAPAVGVLVTHEDRPNVKLYFDKQTHLLVKVERRGKSAGQDASLETLLSEPKAFDGVKLATKRRELANGKKIAEWTLTGCKFPEKVDDNVFTKP